MTDDLSILPESVREALRRTDVTIEMFDTLVTVNRDDYDTIRAELLRLAKENAVLRERAEDELAKLRKRIDGAPIADADDLSRGVVAVPREWIGKRVRLVEDDE